MADMRIITHVLYVMPHTGEDINHSEENEMELSTKQRYPCVRELWRS